MTYGAFTQDFAPYEYGVRSRKPIPQIGLCLVALGLTTSVGVWALRAHTAAPMVQVAAVAPVSQPLTRPAPQSKTTPAAQTAPVAKVASAAPVASPSPPAPFSRPGDQHLGGMLDPQLTTRFAAVVFARSVPLRAGLEPQRVQAPEPAARAQVAIAPEIVPPPQILAAPQITLPQQDVPPSEVSPLVKDVPLPQRRPADLAPTKVALAPMPAGRRPAMEEAAPAPAAPGRPSFFDKLFGRSERPGPALAYAAPEDSVIGNVLGNPTGRPAPVDRYTAVYNITTHTVTLPDGTQLEAHSGLGAAKDNPRMVTQRMVGATPPNVYDLTVREAPFHGVRALRLTPTGGTTFGRAGLLAHTYMLRGRSGESNGCVVFRDYPAFLRAFDSGAVRRLAVVAGA